MEYFDRLRGFTEEAVDWQKVPRQRPFNGKLLPNYFQKNINAIRIKCEQFEQSIIRFYAKGIQRMCIEKPVAPYED
jgi:hypothetical protein